LAHDVYTLLTMDYVSQLTGDRRYVNAADAYRRFFLRRCAPATGGLFPCGEHAFWHFLDEDIARPIHEDLGLTPAVLLDTLWAIEPQAVERHIRALRNHVMDDGRWYWNRHTPIEGRRQMGIRAIPRHGGFYLYQWVYLYTKRRAPDLLDWAKRTAEVHWAQRHPETGHVPYFVVGDSKHGGDADKARTVPAQTLSLGLSLLDANALLGDDRLPRFDEIGRTYVAQALKAGHEAAKGRLIASLPAGQATAGKDAAVRPAFWDSLVQHSGGYGLSGGAKFALLCLAAHKHVDSPEHLRLADQVWAGYQSRPCPKDQLITPGTFAGVIALSLELYELTGDEKYLCYAQTLADVALDRLMAGGLFRAATGKDYYEAANGPGALAYELLHMHCVLTDADIDLPSNDWDR
jgi:hypothetical protein